MPSRALRLALLASSGLAALVAGACTSEQARDPEPSVGLAPDSPWPKFRADAAQTGRGKVAPKATGGALWEVRTAKGIFSSPVIGADGTTFIGSADRTFYAIARDGAVKWTVKTGEIIDSAALLDDRGRVYFGSGDGKLRALEAATGREVWTMEADDPAVNEAFIRWFEGNVAIGPSGTLYVPNDNFFLYAVDRDTGAVRWRYRMPDQTWSLPAVDPRTETLYVGNNNVLPLLGKNTFAIAADGTNAWSASSLGSIAASPMIAGERVIVGGFDGWVRAYDKATGDLLWETPTRDHVYASPALLPDGTIVQPSADGTVYALDPATGEVRWTFDTPDPIRSSPAVDAEGNVYFGGGDGRLWVLRPDGTLRWSMRLVDDERNDLNSSPALGHDGIVIASESGQIFGVPYDFCLRPEADGDARCATTAPALPEGASLRFVTAMGATADDPPALVDGNEPITMRLDVRQGGRARLATLDAASTRVTTTPPVELEVKVAGDGKFVTVTPKTAWPEAAEVTVTSGWLVDHARTGLRLSGGAPGGEATRTFPLRARPRATAAVTSPAAPGEVGSRWEIARLALPMPTLMPSYNQIGFDSLHYLVGMVEPRVAWMIGARLDEGDATVADPTTRALFPLEVAHDGDLLTLSSREALRVEVMSAVIPFTSFRIAARLGEDGSAAGLAKMTGGTVCATVPFYGPFLQTLGLCNPQTDELVVAGGAILRPARTTLQRDAIPEIGAVSVARTGTGVRATLAASRVRAASHVVGLLLVDAQTGKPVTLDYGLDTKRELDAEGHVVAVEVPFRGRAVPGALRAHVLVDLTLAATRELR